MFLGVVEGGCLVVGQRAVRFGGLRDALRQSPVDLLPLLVERLQLPHFVRLVVVLERRLLNRWRWHVVGQRRVVRQNHGFELLRLVQLLDLDWHHA